LLDFRGVPVVGKVTLITKTDNLRYGDIIETVLFITEAQVTNPGQRDFASLNRLSGIYATATETSPIVIIGNTGSYFYTQIFNIREWVRNRINQSLDYSRAFALALILGDRQFLDEYGDDFYTEVLPQSGIMHLFAVSGLHVWILVLALTVVFQTIRLPSSLSYILILCILIVFVFILNLSPPVIRAVIFFSLLMIGEMMSRQLNKWHILLVTIFIVTVANPQLLFSVSLQYSFMAFCGIIFYSSIMDRLNKIYEIVSRRILFSVLKYVIFMSCVHLMLLSPTIYYFDTINLNTFFANIICIPIFTIVFPLLFLNVILPNTLVFYSIEFLTDIFNTFVQFFSHFPFVFSYSGDLIQLITMQVMIFLGLLFIVYGRYRKTLLKGMMLCLLALCFLIPTPNVRGFKMIFFDTGNSDAILIRFSADDYMVIDSASFDHNSKNISRNMMRYLKKENVSNIRKVLITHPHSDHYGGIFHLAKHVQIDTLIVSKHFMESSIGDRIASDNNYANTTIFIVSDTLTYKHSEYEIKFLHPDLDYRHGNVNNMSIVCKLIYNDLEILFTGDIEREAERYLINKYPQCLSSDILKAAHHGSRTSSQSEFLSYVNPELFIVTASGNMRRGFPNRTVLENAGIYARQIYVTGNDSAVIVEFVKK
jgi:competence protein ComEC